MPSHLLLLSFPYFFLLHGLEAALKSCEIKVKYGSFGANNSHRFHKSIHAVIYKKCALVKRLKKTKNLAEVEMITLTQSSSFLVEHRSFTCAPPPDSLRAGSPSGQYLTHAQWQWQPWQLFQLIPDAVVFRKSSWWRSNSLFRPKIKVWIHEPTSFPGPFLWLGTGLFTCVISSFNSPFHG